MHAMIRTAPFSGRAVACSTSRCVVVAPRRGLVVENAHKKGAGSTKNGRDSKSKRRGVKSYGNQPIKAGGIIVRQLGSTVGGSGRRSQSSGPSAAIRPPRSRVGAARGRRGRPGSKQGARRREGRCCCFWWWCWG